jgi:hypoxanthine phosphoribosyltransferase
VSTSVPVLGETLVDAVSIRRRVAELAAEIDAHYADARSPIVLLCVLKGSLIFTADLARLITVPVEIDFIRVRSYGAGARSDGRVEMVKDADLRLRGRDVLLVEDVVDTGHTVAFLQTHLAQRGARSVRCVTLLDKTSRRVREVHIDWAGFAIPDRFVVGYGLDHGERYRNLADVRVLDGV